MKIYFHATDGERYIRDEKGIEVADVELAREQSLRTFTEFRREQELEDGFSGWRLQVVDAAGLVVFTLDLD
jgi:hypothetical protein